MKAAQTWVDNDPSKPLSAARMNYIESRTSEAALAGGALVNVREPPFNAKGDGGGDDTLAFQKAYEALPLVNGRHTGEMLIPTGRYPISGLLDFSTAGGVVIRGQGTTPGRPEIVWTPGAGSGEMISVKSGFGMRFRDLLLVYNNAAYDGNLINTEWGVSKSDVRDLELLDCYVGGIEGATKAASLVRLNKTINSKIISSQFQNAERGITRVIPAEAVKYANSIQIEGCEFANLKLAGIYNPGNAWRIWACTFEPNAAGEAVGVSMETTYWTTGLVFMGNYLGDVTAAGSVKTWVTLRDQAGLISGNYSTTPGSGAGSTHYALDSCSGTYFGPNFMELGTNGVQFLSTAFFCEGCVVAAGSNSAATPLAGLGNTRGLTIVGGAPITEYENIIKNEAKVERATGAEIEASAIVGVNVTLTIKTKASTKTVVQLLVNKVVIAEQSVGAAVTTASLLTMYATVPRAEKWELKVVEGTVEKLESSYLPLYRTPV